MPEVKGAVSFENVRFSYPDAPDKIIIKNFSAEVSPGQKVAIVGPTVKVPSGDTEPMGRQRTGRPACVQGTFMTGSPVLSSPAGAGPVAAGAMKASI